MKATTKDLRLHTPELLAATERGEEVVITFRGKPRAVLTAYKLSPEARTDRNPAFGLWVGSERAAALSVEAEVRALRKPRPLV